MGPPPAAALLGLAGGAAGRWAGCPGPGTWNERCTWPGAAGGTGCCCSQPSPPRPPQAHPSPPQPAAARHQPRA
ncbi:hypothetical protein V8C86DRAFT_2593992 [Haematococcus lacustris]